MKLIAITEPEFFEGENRAICRLLDHGWWRVHIRKPDADVAQVEELLKAVPGRYRASLSLHDHFHLAEKYSIGGLHLNNRNSQAPLNWEGLVSRSCHSLEEISYYSGLDYLTLSPVFDSISKPGYLGAFNGDVLKEFDLKNVFALGGVTFRQLPVISLLGFSGGAMLTQAWKTKNSMLQFITHTVAGLEEVLQGGCRWVQLRMKDVSDAEFAKMAKLVMPLCRKYGATVIFDDRINLVAELGADGVHLGKTDMPIATAREILGEGKIIGATANTLADIIAAYKAGADYIGLGPFRFTTTKKNLSPLLGMEGYSEIMAACRHEGIAVPVVAIGGIRLEDIEELRSTGIDGIAVSGLLLNSHDIITTTRKILKEWKS